MSTWRLEGEECPIPPQPIMSMSMCQPCIFFRGASSFSKAILDEETGEPFDPPQYEPTIWNVNCNFPRNGSDIWKPLEKPLDDYTDEEIRNMTK